MNESDDKLERFLIAQERVYATALSEIESGRKRSHWMWFIFPQLRGLGFSEKAHYFGLADRAEAEAYLAHPELGERLRACTRALLTHAPRLSAFEILGSPDDVKLRSCLTLFAAVAPDEVIWKQAIAAFFEGLPDPWTLRMLGQ